METPVCSLEDAVPLPCPGLPLRWQAFRLLVVMCLSSGGLREFHPSDDRVLRLPCGRDALADRRGRAAPRRGPPPAGHQDRRGRPRLSAPLLRPAFLRGLRPPLHWGGSP